MRVQRPKVTPRADHAVVNRDCVQPVKEDRLDDGSLQLPVEAFHFTRNEYHTHPPLEDRLEVEGQSVQMGWFDIGAQDTRCVLEELLRVHHGYVKPLSSQAGIGRPPHHLLDRRRTPLYALRYHSNDRHQILIVTASSSAPPSPWRRPTLPFALGARAEKYHGSLLRSCSGPKQRRNILSKGHAYKGLCAKIGKGHTKFARALTKTLPPT